MKVYLDYAATHPPIKSIIEKANELYLNNFANSSGLSGESQKVNNLIRESRSQLAQLLSISEQQIFFYSSASEAHSSLLWLLSKHCFAQKKSRIKIACSPFEHPSIIETVKKIPDAEVFFFEADKAGLKEMDLDAINPDLIICMAAHNETGLLMPISNIIQWSEEHNIPMLCDCVQLAPKLNYDSQDNRINGKLFQEKKSVYFTMAGHKIGAGFGCAILITPKLNSTELAFIEKANILAGGNQETPFRPGSHNLAAIKAMELSLNRVLIDKGRYDNLLEKSKRLEKTIINSIKGVHLIGAQSERLPGTSLLLVPDLSIDFLLMALDQKGITVGTGTSCKSRSREASPALLAMGYTEEEALQAIRISLGPEIPGELLEKASKAIIESILKLQNQ